MSESSGASASGSLAACDGIRRCVLQGEVTSSGALCDVISFLAKAAWWGELVVEHANTTRSLFFDERHVVAAASTAESERLGAVLVRCGTLTDEQAKACAERASDRNLRFGEALVELGFIQREELFTLMGKQLQDIFSGIAALENGQFSFLAGFTDADLPFRQKHGVDGLLRDAVSKMDETRYFRSRIPTDDHVPVRASDVLMPSIDPLGVFAAIDGRRSVAELAETVRLPELAVTRALFQHVQTGHAKIKPPRLEARETIKVYNDAIVALLCELDEMGQGNEVREELAKFAGAAALASFWPSATRAANGALDVEAMIAKIESASNPDAAEERLGRWFYDYASYAVFLAQPRLERRGKSQVASVGEPRVAPPELKPGRSTVRMRRFSNALVPGLDSVTDGTHASRGRGRYRAGARKAAKVIAG